MHNNMKQILALTAAALVLASCGGASQKQNQPAENQGNGTVSCTFEGTVDYDEHFTSERLRIDFVLAGDSENITAYLGGLSREPEWAGSKKALVDPFGYGAFYMEVFDGEDLVFSRGFNSLFEEWRTTDEANNVSKCMTQTMWMPFPKDEIKIVLYSRRFEDNCFEQIFTCEVDPQDKLITNGPRNDFKVEPLMVSGDKASKVDLLFVAEGYNQAEMEKYRKDAQRFADYMFSIEPYASRKSDFNLWLLMSPSADSGVDIPQDDSWKNTVLQSNFFTFYMDRYLTVWDHSKIADAVSGAAFDALFIIANSEKYGGGGIYNSYALGSSDNERSNPVFIHEFGHSFAGLADEYFTKQVAYEDYYNLKLEPWEPNITTLVNFDAKWADMLPEDAVIPTQPNDSTMVGVLGVFEGGGYMTKGVYRPYFECRMRNNTAGEGFCPVCRRAIERMIDFYIQ